MSEEKVLEKLEDATLEEVSGGVTSNMRAAFAVMRGDYGNGAERMTRLEIAGYNPNVVQGLVNDYLKYGSVAQDVIDGKYGNGAERVHRLRAAGYPVEIVQNLVNNLLL